MIKQFTERLAKIGIKLTYIGNYPWIYLATVNGNKVLEKFQANHGFTIFMLQHNGGYKITDRRLVFETIRKYL